MNTIHITVEDSSGKVVTDVWIPQKYEEAITLLLEEMKR